MVQRQSAMPTCADPPYRLQQFPMRYDGVRDGTYVRPHKAPFVSREPQRLELSPDISRTFVRSNARVLGPGTYDPRPPSEWGLYKEPGRRSSFFVSKRPIRPERSALVDLHGRELEEASRSHTLDVETASDYTAAALRSMYFSAPGALDGPTIPKAERFPDRRKQREVGQSHFYDTTRGNLRNRIEHRDNLRRYAPSFQLGTRAHFPVTASHELTSSSSTPDLLGPGVYTLPDPDVGLRTRENHRRSWTFAQGTGGKLAGTGGNYEQMLRDW